MGLFSRFSKKKNKEESFTCFICDKILPVSQKNGSTGDHVACKKCSNKFMALILLVNISKERELNVRELGKFERLWNAKGTDDPKASGREDRMIYKKYLEAKYGSLPGT